MDLEPLGKEPKDADKSKEPMPDHAWTPPDDDDAAEYEVSRVVAKQERRGGAVVRVRWVGWSSEADTWEPARNFEAKDKIAEFEADVELCGVVGRVNEWRRYLLKDMCFAGGERVTKTDRGVARAQILRLLRVLEKLLCGDGPGSVHARNVLGSCVFEAVRPAERRADRNSNPSRKRLTAACRCVPIRPQARVVPLCVGQCCLDFDKVKGRGSRVWNAEGSLVDVGYEDLLAVIARISDTIMQAVQDEHESNDAELLQELLEEEEEEDKA